MSVLSSEDRKIKTEFDTVFQNMPDRSIQRVLREVKTCVFETAMLYADETLLSKSCSISQSFGCFGMREENI